MESSKWQSHLNLSDFTLRTSPIAEKYSQYSRLHLLVRKCILMDGSAHIPSNLRYLPVITPITATVGNSTRIVSIATVEAPDKVCGRALRIGYVGKLATDFALYRLRIKTSPDLVAITLPGFFILENSLFHSYIP